MRLCNDANRNQRASVKLQSQFIQHYNIQHIYSYFMYDDYKFAERARSANVTPPPQNNHNLFIFIFSGPTNITLLHLLCTNGTLLPSNLINCSFVAGRTDKQQAAFVCTNFKISLQFLLWLTLFFSSLDFCCVFWLDFWLAVEHAHCAAYRTCCTASSGHMHHAVECMCKQDVCRVC